MSKKEACRLEQKYIRYYKPIYNKPQGLSLLKINNDLLKKITDLRLNGLSYKQISEKVGLSTMTVYRAINGKTKNIETLK